MNEFSNEYDCNCNWNGNEFVEEEMPDLSKITSQIQKEISEIGEEILKLAQTKEIVPQKGTLEKIEDLLVENNSLLKKLVHFIEQEVYDY